MRIAAMGHDKIRYLVYSKGRWRWQPTRAMRKHGFQNVKLSKGGPELDSNGYPAANRDYKLKAVEMNVAWDAVMLGSPAPAPHKPVTPLTVYPEGQRAGWLQTRHGTPQGRQTGQGSHMDN